MLIGALSILCLLVLIGVHAYRSGYLHVSSPVFLTLCWCAVLVVGRPAYIELSGHWELVDYFCMGRPSDGTLVLTFATIALGIAAYYVGFCLLSQRWLDQIRLPRLPVQSRSTAWITVIFLVWGIINFAIYKPLPVETGLYNENFQVEEGRYVETSAYVASAWLCITAVIYMLATMLRNRLYSLVLLGAYGFAIFYGGWSRSVAITAALGVAMIEELRRQKRVVAIALLAGVPLLVPVFNQLSVDREYVQKEFKGETSSGRSEDFLPNEFSDFDGFVGVVDHVPEKLDYSYGMEMVNRFFVIAIPRTLWPEKRNLLMPDDKYNFRDRISIGGRVNTVFGPAYLEGGIVAVLVLLGCIGAAARIIFALVLAHRDEAHYVALYVLVNLHLLCAWRDLFQPQYFFLTGQPVLLAIGISWFTHWRGRHSMARAAAAS